MKEECVINPNNFPCECIDEPIRYRVRSICLQCDDIWISKAKEDDVPPVRCKKCGSYRIKKLYAWKVKKKKSTWNNFKKR